MGAIIRDAFEFNFTKDDHLLIDTNIWVYIIDQQASQSDPGYAPFLYKTLIQRSVNLYTTPIIIQEYINQSIRTSYTRYTTRKNLDKRSFDFKHNYCYTDDFKQNYDLILDEIQGEILPITTLIDSSQKVLTSALETRKSFDFNDELIIQCATQNNFAILTNDSDFDKNAEGLIVYHGWHTK